MFGQSPVFGIQKSHKFFPLKITNGGNFSPAGLAQANTNVFSCPVVAVSQLDFSPLDTTTFV